MRTYKMTITATIDEDLWHGSDKEGIEWFKNEISNKDNIAVFLKNDVSDFLFENVDSVKVEDITK